MVNPLPPPRTYRAKTRLARCRARAEAKRKTEESTSVSSQKRTWLPFSSPVEGVSSFWSGESEVSEIREAFEVSIQDSFPSSPVQNWASDPINEEMRNVPVIPLPPPSSMFNNRNSRIPPIPPLQQRDTNRGSDKIIITSGNSPPRKFVSRPIESSRGRKSNANANANANINARRRSRSRSRTAHGGGKSIMRVKGGIERSASDTSISNDSKESVSHSSDENKKQSRSRSRSRTRRERSASIVRGRRNNSSTVATRSRSLSIAALRSSSSSSSSTLRAQNIVRENRRITFVGSPDSKTSSKGTKSSNGSRDAKNQNGPPLPHNHHRQGQTSEPNSGRQTENNSILRRHHNHTAPQPSRVMLNNSTANQTQSTFGVMNNVVSLPNPIHTRTLLTSSVYNNEATGIWITTINMNQKSNVTRNNAAKYLKAFSFQTEREARESAYANAPARLHPFNEHPQCFVCDAKFGVLRRPSHCRNCGVVVCNSCTSNWSKQSIPETFNIKNENSVKVCRSCDSLSKMFRQALVQADYEKALTIYNTGNINLRCQFMSMKGAEAMLPIHCAAEGGSLQLLQWLVDVHHCPIKRIRTSNKNKSQTTNELITTSKGRNVLEIAMAGKRVEIMDYLVNVKNATLNGIKSLDVALDALYAVLLAYPSRPVIEDEENQTQYDSPSTHHSRSPGTPMTPMTPLDRNRHTPIRNGIPIYDINMEDSDDESTDSSASQNNDNAFDSDDEQSVATTVHDAVSIRPNSFSIPLNMFMTHAN